MAENIIEADLESEIAELTRQIENKKRILEAGHGLNHEATASGKEVVAETIAEHFYAGNTSVTGTVSNDDKPTQVPVKPSSVSKDYLDNLTPEVVESINSYVSMISESGIRKTVKLVQSEQPFIIDAFHDALSTRLYDELKQRGVIK
jgi:hypothetical protein